MSQWWEIDTPQLPGAVPKFRAVAYYRHSAQDRQENSIPIQRDQVREWAQNNGVEIIQEFADASKSGLTSEGRPAFTEMMDEWVKKRTDFSYILCLDVSRWGRFQDIDLSAQTCRPLGRTPSTLALGITRFRVCTASNGIGPGRRSTNRFADTSRTSWLTRTSSCSIGNSPFPSSQQCQCQAVTPHISRSAPTHAA